MILGLGLALFISGCAVKVKTVKVGDLDMTYKEYGRGYPLIMIMGYSGTMDMWDAKVLNEFSRRYRVIVLDNRGMGLTSTGTKKFTIRQFADDTAGLMEALKIRKAHVLGWSMGTNIAQELALDHPDKVDRLILYAADAGGKEGVWPPPKIMQQLTDTSGTPQERGMRLLKLLFPPEWLKQNPDPRKYFPRASEGSSPQNIDRQTRAMMSWGGSYRRLPQIKSPTLLLTGTEDVLTPPQNSFIIGKRIPGAWIVQLKGGGHGLMYQFPEKFSRIILAFLEN